MPIRVSMVQPALAAYRIPVFRELAARQGIELTVYCGSQPNLPNAEPDRFRAVPIKTRTLTLRGKSLIIVPKLLSLASKKTTDVLLVPWNTR